MQPLKRIAILGPESTGKTSLCAALAKHYHTSWAPEYAREYLTVHGTRYEYSDLLAIAKGQVANEEAAAKVANKLLFIDTDMHVMKVWSEFVFGKCDEWILQQAEQRKYDLYLLCNTDLPWVKDEMREYPDPEIRVRLYNIYKNLLEMQSAPWVDISGGYEERLQKAIAAVDRFIGKR